MNEVTDTKSMIFSIKHDMNHLVELVKKFHDLHIIPPVDDDGIWQELYPPVPPETIANFEMKYNISLPPDYKMFFLEVENGEMGPQCGIIPFEKNLNPGDFDFDEVNPTRPFQVSRTCVHGAIFVCRSQTPFLYFILALTGKERGSLWAYFPVASPSEEILLPFPDFSPDSPRRQSFLGWFSEWIDEILPAMRLTIEEHEHPWRFITKETTKIDLRSRQLTTLKGFPLEVPFLRSLILNDNKFHSLQGWPSSFPALEELSFVKNSLDSLKGFPSKVPVLRNLRVTSNNLQNLEGLPFNLPALEEFSVDKNLLQDLKGFPVSLPSLREIILRENRLTNLTGFPHDVPNLEKLDLSRNPLISLVGLPQTLPKLRVLALHDTKIESLSPLPPSIPELEIIGLRGVHLFNLAGLPSQLTKLFTFFIKEGSLRSFHGASRAVLPRVILNVSFREAFREGCAGLPPARQSCFCFPATRQLVQACLDAAPPWPRDAPLPPEPPPLAAALDRLHATYARPPAELVTAFLADEARLTPGELERLAVEVPPAEVSALREKLPPDHPIFRVLGPSSGSPGKTEQ